MGGMGEAARGARGATGSPAPTFHVFPPTESARVMQVTSAPAFSVSYKNPSRFSASPHVVGSPVSMTSSASLGVPPATRQPADQAAPQHGRCTARVWVGGPREVQHAFGSEPMTAQTLLSNDSSPATAVWGWRKGERWRLKHGGGGVHSPSESEHCSWVRPSQWTRMTFNTSRSSLFAQKPGVSPRARGRSAATSTNGDFIGDVGMSARSGHRVPFEHPRGYYTWRLVASSHLGDFRKSARRLPPAWA